MLAMRTRELLMILEEKDVARFLGYLKRDPETGCLLYQGYRDPDGYGRFRIGRKGSVKAHRVAFWIGGGVASAETPYVLHHCDNPACCEFTHLWAGSQVDNMRDMVAKGRSQKSRRGLPFGAQKTRSGRYAARAWINRVFYHLGTFDTAEEASAVALASKLTGHPVTAL